MLEVESKEIGKRIQVLCSLPPSLPSQPTPRRAAASPNPQILAQNATKVVKGGETSIERVRNTFAESQEIRNQARQQCCQSGALFSVAIPVRARARFGAVHARSLAPRRRRRLGAAGQKLSWPPSPQTPAPGRRW